MRERLDLGSLLSYRDMWLSSERNERVINNNTGGWTPSPSPAYITDLIGAKVRHSLDSGR